MDCSDSANENGNAEAGNALPRNPRILLAACGCVDAVKFRHVCRYFSQWAEIRSLVSSSFLRFIGTPLDEIVFCDAHGGHNWRNIDDPLLNIDLLTWADVLVIAPLSTSILRTIAEDVNDNLLTRIVRQWDYRKPIFVAPSMRTSVWHNPLIEEYAMAIDELGISLIPPVQQMTVGGESYHAMAEPFTVYSTVRVFYELNMQ